MIARKCVWIICQHAGAPRYGMNYRPYNLGRELVARGIDVTVFASPYSHQFFSQPEVTGKYTFEDVDGMRYCWIRTARYGESQSNARVLAWWDFVCGLAPLGRRAASMGIPAPDAILVSSPPPYAILPAVRLARRYGARLVFEVRDLWPLSLISLGGHSPRHPFIAFTQWVEDFAYRHADIAVSALPAAESHMRSHGLAEGKFRYIPNGVSIAGSAFDTDATPSASALDSGIVRAALPGRHFIIGYAGTVGLANALSHFVEAAALLKTRSDIGFAIIGEGAELEALKSLAAERGLDNFAFLPPVAKTRIPGLLAGLDVCYLGLKDEAVFRFGVSPTKLFDYMLAAKPVVMAIDAGNDIVSAAGCGYTVKPESPESIARAIVRLADLEPAEKAALGEAGKRYVITNHDWSVLGGKYADALGVS